MRAIFTWLFGMLVRQRDQETLVGDLIEEHTLIASTRGPRQASVWYWRQMLRSLPPVLWANIRRGIWLKTLGGVLLGYLAVALVVMAGDIVMSRVLPANELVYSLASLAAGIPAMLLGGYLAAWIRPRAAIGLAVLSAAMGVVSLLVTGDRAPLWYQLALILVGPVAAVAGGRIRARRKGSRV